MRKIVLILLSFIFFPFICTAGNGTRTILLLPLQNKEAGKKEKSLYFEKNEFTDEEHIGTLISAIAGSFPDLEIDREDLSLRTLNNLLSLPGFYDAWLPYSGGIEISARVKQYIKETEEYRHIKPGFLTKKERFTIGILNRLLIESSFPALCPMLGDTFFKVSHDYMGSVIADKMKSKFSSSKDFTFVPDSALETILKTTRFFNSDMYDREESHYLATRLHADVVIYGKYNIQEEKQYISCTVYDLMNDHEFSISYEETSLAHYYSMLELFTSELAYKINETIRPLTDEASIAHLFSLTYTGISLGEKYKTVLELVKNQPLRKQVYEERKLLLIKGSLNSAFETNLTLLGFDSENRLSNIWLIGDEGNQEESYGATKNAIAGINRILGSDMEKVSAGHYRWNGKSTSFELISKLLHKNRSSLFYHLYRNGHKQEYNAISDLVSDFEKGWDIAGGGGLGVITDIRWNAYRQDFIFENKKSEIASITTEGPSTMAYKIGLYGFFSFTYFLQNDHAVGIGVKAGYYPSIVHYELGSAALLYMHTVSLSLLMRHKFMTIQDKHRRIVLEVGPGLDLEVIPVRHYEISTKEADGTPTTYIRDLQDEHRGLFGQLFLAPTLTVAAGFEQKLKKSMTIEHLFFLGGRVGFQSFSSYTIEPFYAETEQFGEFYKIGGYLASIIAGYEIRLNYYYFKKL